MIISRIDGGLGNQMFQYAYGFYLAQRAETEFYLDISSYEKQPQHGYLLDHFRIDAEVLPAKLVAKIPRKYRSSVAKVTWLQDRFGLRSLRRHKERDFGFRSSHLQAGDNRYLVGYWQSEQFFPRMRDELLKQFALRRNLTAQSQEIGGRMAESNSVALHVRRGDYVTSQSAAAIYEHLSVDYYHRCLQMWASQQYRPEVYIFSNDIAWCREQFQLEYPTHFVDHTSADTAFEDLWMMQQAACLVMANSTFSWWAAWLNQRSGRQVIAPSRWFRPGAMDGSNILCRDWTVADVDPNQTTPSKAA